LKSECLFFEDDPSPDRPSTSHTEETVARVRNIIRADRRLTIREVVAEEVRIAFSMCQKILTEYLQKISDSDICAPSADGRAEGRLRVSLH